MADGYLRKLPGGMLVADDEETAELIAKMPAGQGVACTLVKPRNYRFLKKWMTLVRLAFDVWSETVPKMQYRGQDVLPNIDRFRRDLTIMAGYFDAVFNARGEMRVEAKSVSFAKMSEPEFEKLYSATIDVILGKVLTDAGLTEADLRAHVDRVMAYC